MNLPPEVEEMLKARQQGAAMQSPQRGKSMAQAQQHKQKKKEFNVLSAFSRLLSMIGRFLMWIVNLLPNALMWITNQGSVIPLGLVTLYFAGINIEGYYLSMGAEMGDTLRQPFLVKPYIDDGASFANLIPALMTGAFWLAAIVSIAVQAVQARLIRDMKLQKAIKRYQEVAPITVPGENPNGLAEAERRRKEIKNWGRNTRWIVGVSLAVVYLFDFIVAGQNFPVFGSNQMLINAVWFIIAIVGAEFAGNLYLDAKEGTADEQVRRAHVVK